MAKKTKAAAAKTRVESPIDERTQQAIRKRSRARELALRALYLLDVRGVSAKGDIPGFLLTESTDSEVINFAQELIDGCVEKKKEIDEKISTVAENWQVYRMAVIDRNVLRIGTYELLYMEDIPPKVTINEAIDLAKRYSTAESGAFVNGILDKLRSQLRKDNS